MKYDTIIIGAGLSGIAAGIRLAHFGKKVCICEQHFREGGLNSYYERQGIMLETGLHAMTNFVPAKSNKSFPLMKLLRQLRIPYDALQLREQHYSKIKFPIGELTFSNDFSQLEESIATLFPKEIDSFKRVDAHIMNFNELDLNGKYQSTKQVLGKFISSPLSDMLLEPLMYYGSAVEDDIDFAQFVIMYKSIYKEGFCRPGGKGIRTILELLFNRYEACDGELRLSTKVKRILTEKSAVIAVELSNGEILECDNVLSSAGALETVALCSELSGRPETKELKRGALSYAESIAIMPDGYDFKNNDASIIFFNTTDKFEYHQPNDFIDPRSGVICFPHNFKMSPEDETVPKAVRLTVLGNYNYWNNLSKDAYRSKKKELEPTIEKIIQKETGLDNVLKSAKFLDMMTPLTIERFTGHQNGAIYGSPTKIRTGVFPVNGLYLCGTDQGFLGIVGAMLSGISIANGHLL